MNKILLIDNYDSFTFNLLHLIESCSNSVVEVVKNDDIGLHKKIDFYNNIVISPGPGIPSEAGLLPVLLDRIITTKKILGVCLGHQAIAQQWGAQVVNMQKVVHGTSSEIIVDNKNPLFKNLPNKILVGRYHSWEVSKENIPNKMKVIAETDQNEIMAFQIMSHPVWGIQFHPESILSNFGAEIINNWLDA